MGAFAGRRSGAKPVTRIGLLGGSFDPIHLGHLVLADEAREQLGLERVLLVPSRQPPHKPGRAMAPPAERLRMVELAVAADPLLEACDVELHRGGPSYSIDTVRGLLAGHAGDWRVHFLIGADTLHELPTWYHIAELADLCDFCVANRPGHRLDGFGALSPPLRPDQVDAIRDRVIAIPPMGVSSTAIRRRVRDGRSIRYLVPEAVRRHIDERGLYRD